MHAGRVLVVDDIEGNRDILARRLRRQKYDVVTAVNGVEALEVLSESSVDLVLLDIMMPEMDGFTVLERMKQNQEWRHVPVIMISALTEMDDVVRCIELGADDYLSKPFNPVVLRARVATCIEKKRLRDQERESLAALKESQQRLAGELAEAADYVRSLLPESMDGLISTEWQFRPSTSLGGDLFGYHWLDDDRLAIYLVDVSGHGVGAALLSVSVVNVIRSSSLPGIDFADPGAVLTALNERYPMEEHNNMYLTAWYGVFHRKTGELRYASGGHPPAVLVAADGEEPNVRLLRTAGLIVGGMPDASYEVDSTTIDSPSRLFIFSDGVYEITKDDGSEMEFDEFVSILAELSKSSSATEDVVARVRGLNRADDFADDVSILGMSFLPSAGTEKRDRA